MNKKGFTLVELLAVITLISLISIMALNIIVKQHNTMKEISADTFEKVLKSSAKSYVNNDEELKLQIKSGATLALTYEELKNKDYIPSDMLDLRTNTKIDIQNTVVCVRYSNYKYTYQIMQKSECN